MNINWAQFVGIFGFALAGVAVLTSVEGLIRRFISLLRDRRNLDRIDTDAAIESGDLGTIGYHLVDRLGSTSLANYARDDDVREDFRVALNAVRMFLRLRDSEELQDEEVALEGSAPDTDDGQAEPSLDPEIWETVAEGDYWTALAKSRRDVEQALRGLVVDPNADERAGSARELLALARTRGAVSRDDAERLRSAVQVANRAIHGFDTAPEVALSAVRVMAEFVQEHAAREAGPAAKGHPAKRKRESRATTGTSRTVVMNAGGHWEVVGPNGVVSHARSQSDAVERARDIAAKSGGGEIVIHGRDGQVRAKDIVTPPDTDSSAGNARGRRLGRD